METATRSFDRNQLKLGFFGLNCSGGLSATLVSGALGRELG